jgi:alkanesulfonate monooxygenase SsuD/methylene tetrahydromethanopterin reductase-like flavin-dependent oxidoreductase (luciferase family)
MVSLDHLSRGRIIIGIGFVNLPNAFFSFREERDPRAWAERFDAGLDIVSIMWSGEMVTYHWKY